MELWIAGQSKADIYLHEKDGDVYRGAWEFAGVFASEEKAIAACLNRTYFIAPAKLDEPWPEESVEWTGAYYPLAEKPEQQTV